MLLLNILKAAGGAENIKHQQRYGLVSGNGNANNKDAHNGIRIPLSGFRVRHTFKENQWTLVYYYIRCKSSGWLSVRSAGFTFSK
jgi:hypothetical protein